MDTQLQGRGPEGWRSARSSTAGTRPPDWSQEGFVPRPMHVAKDTLAERSKAVAQGAIPKGRGFEPHRCHFSLGLPRPPYRTTQHDEALHAFLCECVAWCRAWCPGTLVPWYPASHLASQVLRYLCWSRVQRAFRLVHMILLRFLLSWPLVDGLIDKYVILMKQNPEIITLLR